MSTISKMMADKMNLDLRDMILEVLEGIYLLKKSDKKMQEEGNAYLERAKSELSELTNRYIMLDSLYHFYKVELDLPNVLRVCIDKIDNRQYDDVESELSQLLFDLEDKFDERLQQGVLEK
jgi:hypothetical protein